MARQQFLVRTAAMTVLLGSAVVALAQVAPPVQQNPATGNVTNRVDTSAPGTSDRMLSEKTGFKASEIIGLNIRSTNDENIGEVKDFRIEPNGKIAYAVVSFGGFLGIGDKLFAVPFEALHILKTNDNKYYAHLDVTEQTLKNKQGFDKDHWPEKADASFLTGAARQVGQVPATNNVVPR
jgi:hypothetical protein